MGPLDSLRVDQVGSLLRPEALKDAFAKHRQGALDDASLEAAQDTRAVLRDAGYRDDEIDALEREEAVWTSR